MNSDNCPNCLPEGKTKMRTCPRCQTKYEDVMTEDERSCETHNYSIESRGDDCCKSCKEDGWELMSGYGGPPYLYKGTERIYV